MTTPLTYETAKGNLEVMRKQRNDAQNGLNAALRRVRKNPGVQPEIDEARARIATMDQKILAMVDVVNQLKPQVRNHRRFV